MTFVSGKCVVLVTSSGKWVSGELTRAGWYRCVNGGLHESAKPGQEGMIHEEHDPIIGYLDIEELLKSTEATKR